MSIHFCYFCLKILKKFHWFSWKILKNFHWFSWKILKKFYWFLGKSLRKATNFLRNAREASINFLWLFRLFASRFRNVSLIFAKQLLYINFKNIITSKKDSYLEKEGASRSQFYNGKSTFQSWKLMILRLVEFSGHVEFFVGWNKFLSWKYIHQAFKQLLWFINNSCYTTTRKSTFVNWTMQAWNKKFRYHHQKKSWKCSSPLNKMMDHQ